MSIIKKKLVDKVFLHSLKLYQLVYRCVSVHLVKTPSSRFIYKLLKSLSRNYFFYFPKTLYRASFCYGIFRMVIKSFFFISCQRIVPSTYDGYCCISCSPPTPFFSFSCLKFMMNNIKR